MTADHTTLAAKRPESLDASDRTLTLAEPEGKKSGVSVIEIPSSNSLASAEGTKLGLGARLANLFNPRAAHGAKKKAALAEAHHQDRRVLEVASLLSVGDALASVDSNIN
ncbi:hypothetical protein BDK51DRAFT_29716, partial [Blyttiomyces helicus]